MTASRTALLVAAGVLLMVGGACAGAEDDGEPPSLDGGELGITEVADHIIHLPAGSPDELESSERLATGDINGDGIDDLLIGVPGADGPEGKRPDAGRVFVVPGGDLPREFDAADKSILTVDGATQGDNLGFAVSAGDLNGDGVDDIVAGATGSNGVPGVRTDMGEVFVIFGGVGITGERDLLTGDYDLLLQPAEGFSHLGTSLAVGDVTGDEIADLVAGAPYAGRHEGSLVGSPRTTTGEVYIVFGGTSVGGKISVAEEEQDVRLSGTFEFDQFGQSLSIGDLDGDGIGDIAVGAPGYDAGPDLVDAGVTFAFRGRTDFPERISVSEADLSISGSEPGGRLGDVVSNTGLEQPRLLIAGPTQGAPDRVGCGVLYGVPASEGNLSVDSAATVSYLGSSQGEFFPAAVEPMGLDGVPSVALGSPNARYGAGLVFILGVASEGQVDLAMPPEGVSVLVGEGGQALGAALASGDLDGGGGVNLAILSVPFNGPSGAGAVYVVSQ